MKTMQKATNVTRSRVRLQFKKTSERLDVRNTCSIVTKKSKRNEPVICLAAVIRLYFVGLWRYCEQVLSVHGGPTDMYAKMLLEGINQLYTSLTFRDVEDRLRANQHRVERSCACVLHPIDGFCCCQRRCEERHAFLPQISSNVDLMAV